MIHDSRDDPEILDLTQTQSTPGSGSPPRSRVMPAFIPGEVVAERFRIVRMLGQGGMGQVFEAEDVDLGAAVAVKVIRPELSRQTRTIRRFKREVHLSRQVTHPNVCRIFDYGQHQSGGNWGENVSLLFLTMELLRGETLARRLRRDGPMSPDEALPFIQDMAAALDAAHQAGVVHRDFKCSNVLLVEGEAGVRAVVTDFGLAELATAGSANRQDGYVGTPAYMSPETVTGEEATAASDVYSFGVVVYEMLTGALPFRGPTPRETARLRLEQKAPPPSRRLPHLDPAWDAAVGKCLERDPRNRFPTAGAAAGALAGGLPSSATIAARFRRGALWLGLVALLLLIVPLAGWLQHSVARRERPSVAVFNFKDLGSGTESAWLSTALSEMLSTELAANEQLRLIPGESVARARLELPQVDDETLLAPDTLRRAGQLLATDYVVLGSYLVLGEEDPRQIRLELHLQDTRSRETVASVAENGGEGAIFELVARSARSLRRKLGVEGITEAEARAVRATLSANREAVRLYGEGLAKLHSFDALAARGLLLRAVELDPGYALAYSALSQAYTALGYDPQARESARKAYELAEGLSREETLLVEGRYFETSGEWQKAIETYQALSRFFPDDVDHVLRLARAEEMAARERDALQRLETLSQHSQAARQDPRVDLAIARISRTATDFPRYLAAAERALRTARGQGASTLVAQALLFRSRALRIAGRIEEAMPGLQEARSLFQAAGDRNSTAEVMMELSILHEYSGNAALIEELLRQAMVILQELGNRKLWAYAASNLAYNIFFRGELRAARELLEEAIRAAEESGDLPGKADYRDILVWVVLHQGELEKVRSLVVDVAKDYEDRGLMVGVAWANDFFGRLELACGNLPLARQYAAKAVEPCAGKEKPHLYLCGFTYHGFGDVLWEAGEPEKAREMYDQAWAIRQEAQELEGLTESRLTRARLALAEGRFRDAAEQASDLADELGRMGRPDAGARAAAIAARAYRAMGDLELASQALERVADHAVTTETPAVRLVVAVERGRLLAARGDFDDALRVLKQAADEAREHTTLAMRLEIGLALGETEVTAGRAEAGNRRLARLAEEAEAAGFLRLAGQARRSLPGRNR